jgi:hypothetical protein
MAGVFWPTRPLRKQAAEPAPKSVHRSAHERLARTVQENLAEGYQIGSHSDSQAVLVKRPQLDRAESAPAAAGKSQRRAEQLRCSFCRAALGEHLELTIPGSGKHGQRAPTGSFCSTRCRNCVLALAALHPSPLASSDFLAKRALLTDRLLDLWRRGEGPDPALVLQAAEAASSGLAIAAAV